MYTQADHRVIQTELKLMMMGLEEAQAVRIAPRLTFGIVTRVTTTADVIEVNFTENGAARTAFYDVKGYPVAA